VNEFLQTLVGGLTLGAQYALMALGFSLIFGILGVINFAHGGFYAMGGFVAYYVTQTLGMPYVLGVLAAVVATAALGYVFELVVLEPRIDDHLATIVLTLGLSLILGAVLLVIFGPRAVEFTSPVSGTLRLGGVFIPTARLMVIIVSVVAILAVYLVLYRTRIGGALRALADDRSMAVVQGMQPRVLFPLAFALATGLAGLTGALVTPLFNLAPFVGERVLMISFLAVILGGLGSLPGAVLASLLVGVVESYVGVYIGGSWAPLMLFSVVLVLLVVRPTGLLGRRTVGA
jgi:branched-chain amino acid transport system permease protein